MRRVLACAVVLAAGCGGGAPTAPTPPANSGTTFTGTVAGYAITSHDYTTPRAGTLTATLSWTGTADLDLYVTTQSCSGYPPDACVLLARSVRSSGQQETVSLQVTASMSLRVWIDNFAPQTSAPYTLTVDGPR